MRVWRTMVHNHEKYRDLGLQYTNQRARMVRIILGRKLPPVPTCESDL